MRITFENDKKLTLIYIYVREFDGVIVNTIPDIQADLIFDKNDYWLGVEVFNDTLEDYKIRLPNLKKQYITINNEIFMQSKDRLYILFEADKSEGYRKRVSCNLDYNNVNGLLGIELILSCFDIKTKIAQKFIVKHR